MPSRLLFVFFLAIICLLPISTSALAQSYCKAPELTKEQVHKIIMDEREKRSDLPAAFEKYEYSMDRQFCSYRYREDAIPYHPHQHFTFTLNQYGVIIRAQGGHALDIEINCPNSDKNFTDKELVEIIKNIRKLRKDLPPPLSKHTIRWPEEGNFPVEKTCLYAYFEFEAPFGKKEVRFFYIDLFGEVISFDIVLHPPKE